VLFVGSFPPRRCGIATFTNDLVRHFDACTAAYSEVVAIDDASDEQYAYCPRVIGRIHENELRSYAAAAELINAHPSRVVNLQHEYGLFGGHGGAWAIQLMSAIEKPIVLTLHTVLPDPRPEHFRLARSLSDLASDVVVLSQTARTLLLNRYDIAPEKVKVIHHGAPDVSAIRTNEAKSALALGNGLIVSTFGLVSSGKGLEYAIAAMLEVVQRYPDALYLIVGATHPNVRRAEGERYRDSLRERISALGLENNVRMIDRYLALHEVLEYLQASDVYVTPYCNADQVVSGTLAYALAAGKAIVSTPYAYARELLADGRGLLAEFRDSQSIAAAIERLLSDSNLRSRTAAAAYEFGRRMIWPTVAAEYSRLFARAAVHLPIERETVGV
jgi:glycosyltransferase involved in cell wall biosynthesis